MIELIFEHTHTHFVGLATRDAGCKYSPVWWDFDPLSGPPSKWSSTCPSTEPSSQTGLLIFDRTLEVDRLCIYIYI